MNGPKQQIDHKIFKQNFELNSNSSMKTTQCLQIKILVTKRIVVIDHTQTIYQKPRPQQRLWTLQSLLEQVARVWIVWQGFLRKYDFYPLLWPHPKKLSMKCPKMKQQQLWPLLLSRGWIFHFHPIWNLHRIWHVVDLEKIQDNLS